MPQDVRIVSVEEVEELVRRLELQHGMTSAEFVQKWYADQVPDTFETNLWISLYYVLHPDERPSTDDALTARPDERI